MENMGNIIEVAIQTEWIKISQLLKLAQIISSGSDAKSLAENGALLLNGQPVVQRGKKVYPGDVVDVKGTGERLLVKREGHDRT